MIVVVIVLCVLFLMVGMFMGNDDERPQQLMMLGLSIFLGLGGIRLSYYEEQPYYAYIALAFVITAIVYCFYVFYLIMSNKQDWGDEVDKIERNEYI